MLPPLQIRVEGGSTDQAQQDARALAEQYRAAALAVTELEQAQRRLAAAGQGRGGGGSTPGGGRGGGGGARGVTPEELRLQRDWNAALLQNQRNAQQAAQAQATLARSRGVSSAELQAQRAWNDALKEQEQRARAVAAANAAAARARTPMGRASNFAQGFQDEESKYSNLQQTLGTARNIGLGMVGVGGAGLYGAFQAAQMAGGRQMIDVGFSQAFRGDPNAAEKGTALRHQVEEFARVTPFRTTEALDTSRFMLATGTKPEDLVRELHAVGGAVAGAGGGSEALQGVLRQIGQIRGTGRATAQDLNVMGTWGINARQILKEQGITDIPHTRGEDVVQALLRGMEARGGGVLEKAQTTLPAQTSTLQDNFELLTIQLGTGLLPIIQPLAAGVGSLANALRSIPQPILTIAAGGATLTAALLTLGGGLLLVASTVGNVMIFIKSYQAGMGVMNAAMAVATRGATLNAAATTTAATGTNAFTLSLGRLIPLLMGPAGIAAGLAAVYLAAQKIKSGFDELSNIQDKRAGNTDNPASYANPATAGKWRGMDWATRAASLEKQADAIESHARGGNNARPGWGTRLGIGSIPLLGPLALGALEATGAREDNSFYQGERARAESLRRTAESYRRFGREGRALPGGGGMAGGGIAGSALTAVSGLTPADAARAGVTGTAGGGTAAGAAGDYTGPSASSFTARIRALQNEIRHTGDKFEQNQLKEKLVQLREAQQDARAGEAEARKAAAERKRIEREQLRLAGYAARGTVAGIGAGSDADRARVEAAQSRADALAKRNMDNEIYRLEAMQHLGFMRREDVDQQAERLKNAYERKRAAMEAESVRSVAATEAAAVIAEAAATAAGQPAAQRASTMAAARAKAAGIQSVAGIKAQGILDVAAIEHPDSVRPTESQLLLQRLMGGGSIPNRAQMRAMSDQSRFLAISKQAQAGGGLSQLGSGLDTAAGLLQAGNIDLYHRPVHRNKDGSISTVKSMSFEEEGREVLVPTVSPSGQMLSNRQAIDLYHRTGQFLGKFDNPTHADAYAQALHKQQEALYSGGIAPQVDFGGTTLGSARGSTLGAVGSGGSESAINVALQQGSRRNAGNSTFIRVFGEVEVNNTLKHALKNVKARPR